MGAATLAAAIGSILIHIPHPAATHGWSAVVDWFVFLLLKIVTHTSAFPLAPESGGRVPAHSRSTRA